MIRNSPHRLVLPILLAAGSVGLAGEKQDSVNTRASEGIDLEVPDTPVLTQDGEAVRFYTDLVKGKVVVINFIFTTCKSICPPLGATFGRLQTLLGDKMGRQVRLISVSVDPKTDTPERLKAWGAKFKAGPGWTLVTGKNADIAKLLKALNSYTADPAAHTPMVLIGSEAPRSWHRAYGMAPSSALVETIEKVAKTAAKRAQ